MVAPHVWNYLPKKRLKNIFFKQYLFSEKNEICMHCKSMLKSESVY